MQALFSIIGYCLFWSFAFFLTRFLLCSSRAPILLHSLPPPSTPTSITYRHFHCFHSPCITISPIRRQHPSQYSFHSSLRRCRNQSRPKLPLLSSPTQVH